MIHLVLYLFNYENLYLRAKFRNSYRVIFVKKKFIFKIIFIFKYKLFKNNFIALCSLNLFILCINLFIKGHRVFINII